MKMLIVIAAINIGTVLFLWFLRSDKNIKSRTDHEEEILRKEKKKRELGFQENGQYIYSVKKLIQTKK